MIIIFFGNSPVSFRSQSYASAQAFGTGLVDCVYCYQPISLAEALSCFLRSGFKKPKSVLLQQTISF